MRRKAIGTHVCRWEVSHTSTVRRRAIHVCTHVAWQHLEFRRSSFRSRSLSAPLHDFWNWAAGWDRATPADSRTRFWSEVLSKVSRSHLCVPQDVHVMAAAVVHLGLRAGHERARAVVEEPSQSTLRHVHRKEIWGKWRWTYVPRQAHRCTFSQHWARMYSEINYLNLVSGLRCWN